MENILDPTKFCSKKEKYDQHWINSYDRDDADQLDDEQSDSQSGELYKFLAERVATSDVGHQMDSMSIGKTGGKQQREHFHLKIDFSLSSIASYSMIQLFFIHFATAVTFLYASVSRAFDCYAIFRTGFLFIKMSHLFASALTIALQMPSMADGSTTTSTTTTTSITHGDVKTVFASCDILLGGYFSAS